MLNTLDINPTSLEELKKLYKQAVTEGTSQLKFQKQQLMTNYTKYLIEHAENRIYGTSKKFF